MLKHVAISALALSVIVGCKSIDSFTETVRMLNPMGEKIQFIVPAKSNDLKPYDTLNVVSTPETQGVATHVAGIFTRANADGQVFFEQVQVTATENEASDLNLTIELRNRNASTLRSRETRVKCPGKKLVNTCSSNEGYHYNVNCITRKVSLTGQINAFAKEQLITQAAYSDVQEDKICSDTSSNLASELELLNKAATNIANQLAYHYVPGIKKRPLDLIEPETEMSAPQKAIFEQATALITDGNNKAAEKVLLTLTDMMPSEQAMLFNLGYINQAMGNYAIAEGYYKQVNHPEYMSDVEKYRTENNNWLAKNIMKVGKPSVSLVTLK